MKLITAPSAGFCFGVERAVRLCGETAEREGDCFTIGPLIHNKSVTEELRARGITEAEDVSRLPENAAVVIRSHGVSRDVYGILRAKNARITDATCPFVSKIHGIVSEAERIGRLPVIIGERRHAEVEAIAGWCGECRVFETAAEVALWLRENPRGGEKPLTVVFQTTSLREIFDSVSEILKKECTNLKIFDTICDATDRRQREARELARKCDAIVVIGDRGSANSRRLAELAGEVCSRVFFVESAEELDTRWFEPGDTVGITAGASTPARIIKEVTQKMFEETEARTDEISGGAADSGVMTAQAAPEELAPQETIAGEPGSQEPETAPEAPPIQEEQADELYEPENLEDDADEESFEDNPQMFDEILEKSINKTLVTGDSVTGVIAAITQTEVTVDLGIKQPGYIPISELLEDHVINFEEDIKVGASIEAVVARISDYYGTVELSRRGLAAIRTWHELEEAMNTRTVVEGSVVETNKGGVLVSVRGIRVFVPAGRTGLPRGRELTELLKKKARLLINEVNISRGRVIGSISAAAKKERWERLQQIFGEIEPGQRRRGVIKSVKDFGVFVDIGGADGLVHISQLSWIRGMKPADLGDIGDETEVIVLSADKETGRISLSCKLPENDPWANFVEKYKVGDVVPAKVVRLVSFGAFAEIIPGVDGLIHISQITDRRIENPAEGISRDAVTDVKIIGINNETRRVSLSIRELLWEKRRAQEAEAFEEAETFEEAVAPEEAAESESAEPSTETPDESAAPQAAETSAPAEASDTPAEPSAPEETEPPKEAEAPDAPEAPAES